MTPPERGEAYVVAFDGGLTNMGAVYARVTDLGRVVVLAATVLSTEKGGGTAKRAPGAKKAGEAGVTVSSDNRRRVREMSAQVRAFLRGAPGSPRRVDAVVVEAFSRPPHPSAGAKLAMALAVVETWCGELGIHSAEVSPQSIKAALGVERGLDKKASKAAIQSAVDLLLWPSGAHTLAATFLTPAGIAGGLYEHPYDATAALITALEKDRLRAVLPMRT